MSHVTLGNNQGYFQPVIRGIQNVGSVQIMYRYNFLAEDGKFYLPLCDEIKITKNQGQEADKQNAIDLGTGDGIPVAGFRLDAEFLRANPQIASSFVIPILGGGGVALTNNNRTGTLNLVCTRVTAPDVSNETDIGKMLTSSRTVEGSNDKIDTGIGVKSETPYWDFVTLAQIQQGQAGGDSYGAQLKIIFKFCGVETSITFEGCTIATVDPIGLAGNNAVNYAVAVNYLNWKLSYV